VATGTNTIEDKLWLPTEWEMFGANTHSNSNYENSANQGRLGYYANDTSRQKAGSTYLTASPDSGAYWWCGIGSDGKPTRWIDPNTFNGVAPAFTVSAADQPPASNIKTLTYNANGGSGSASQTVFAGASVKVIDGSGFTRANYLFSGWNTQANGGAIYNAGDTINITQDTTLYAKWGVDLIYSANGGTGTPPAKVSSQTATTVTLAPGTGLYKVDATMDGYTRYIYFDCWNTKADGSGVDLWAGESYTLNANVTLYAKYRYSDLMVTFNVKTPGYALSSITTQDVTDTFNKVSAYIKTKSAASVNPSDGLGLIKLGDYVNLKSLNVAAYNSNPTVSITNTNAGDDKLRVMVVGINPYYNKNGNGTSTPHLIFHFKNPPGNARMEATNTNQNGYLGSEMRTYLTGTYWPALKTSGVPDAVVWNISRRVINKGEGASGTHTIADKLWLPTLREMTGASWGEGWKTIYETEANQGRFAYYDSKYSIDNWLASSNPNDTKSFVASFRGGYGEYASVVLGCAPAFAVK
ncbi:MAG: InlB B-repeat-containing protein, partial [Spirochaetaceae bacterium]|nr:InlB B-repeat-containing protein [Spirochaetaceae bacterium]